MRKWMRNRRKECKCGPGCACHHHGCHGGKAVYGLGFIGAAVYYISNATSFWVGVLGVLKALVWPAILVFNALKFLGM